MKQYIDDFLKSFSWYRNLSLSLLDQFPEDKLNVRICKRSLRIMCQFIDLGMFQLKILDMLTHQDYFNTVSHPDMHTATKKEIRAYLLKCDRIFRKEIYKVRRSDTKLDWYGRMTFDAKEALQFLLSHESIHHGEILSGIFANELEMPKAFKQTWGFEL